MRTHPPSMDPATLLSHGDFVRALARRLLADAQEADDLAQDAWVASSGRDLREEGIRAWFSVVTRRLAWKRVARRSRVRAAEHSSARPETVPSAQEVLEREEQRKVLVACVLQLPPIYRDVVLLRYFEELPPRLTAERLQIPVETARTRLKRALEQLRSDLDERHGGKRSVWMAALVPLAASAPPVGAKSTIAVVLLVMACLGLGPWAVYYGLLNRTASQGVRTEIAEAATDALLTNPVASVADSSGANAARQLSQSNEPSREARKLLGTVLSNGTPVEGARVFAWADDAVQAPRISALLENRRAEREAISAADGTFVLPVDDSAAEWSLLAIEASRGVGGVAQAWPQRSVTIHLQSPTSITGRVTSSEGTPIAGATIRYGAVYLGAALELAGLSDAKGEYTISGVPSRSPMPRAGLDLEALEVTAEGYSRLALPVQRSETAEPVRMDLTLIRSGILRGRVIDLFTSRPIPDADIVTWALDSMITAGYPNGTSRESPFARRSLGTVRSDANGRFELASAPTRSPYIVMNEDAAGFEDPDPFQSPVAFIASRAPGYAWHVAGLSAFDEGEIRDVTIALWPAAQIRGRVVDAQGAPVEGAGISINKSSNIERPWHGYAIPDDPRFPTQWTRSAADGTYELVVGVGPESAAEVELEACLDRRRLGSVLFSTNITVSPKPGELVTAPDLVVNQPERIGKVRVRVLDQDGRPIHGARVVHHPNDLSTSYDTTDRDGWATSLFGGFDSSLGPVQLFAAAPGFAVTASSFTTPSIETPPSVLIQLTRELEISGTVRTPDGTPRPLVSVQLLEATLAPEAMLLRARTSEGNSKLWSLRATTDADGAFRFRHVPEGRYHVVASEYVPNPKPGEASWLDAWAASVSSGSQNLDIRLAPPSIERPATPTTRTVVVMVRDAESGRPVLQAKACLRRKSGVHYCQPSGVGRHVSESVAPGEWELFVRARGYSQISRNITVETDSDAQITVDVRRTR